MTRVGIRELKTRLGRYLRLVRDGATLIVTDRGRPVAELRPISAEHDDEEARIDELIALGVLSLDKRGPMPPWTPLELPGVTLSDAVMEDREDRV